MTTAMLVREFERIAEAPDALSKLRRHVYDLAVRGRLEAQHSADEPSRVLLIRCQAALQQAGSRNPIQVLPVEDPPFKLPEGWAWTRLGITGRIFNGTSVGESDKARLSKVVDGLPFIATKDVGYGRTDLAYDNGLKVPLDDPGFKIAHPGTVLICSEGGSAGKKIGLVDRPICFGNKLYANEPWPGMDSEYLLALYQSPYFYAALKERMTGIIGGIALSEFLLLPVPIPPELEQHRIVAKLIELMGVCDELEAAQKEREFTRNRLRSAALHRLTAPDGDRATTASDVRFFVDRSPRLITKPDHVAAFRQAVLDLAVHGRLVPQNPDDQAADELLDSPLTLPPHQRRRKNLRKGARSAKFDATLPPGWACRSVQALYDFNAIVDYADGNHGSLYPRKSEFGADGTFFVTARDLFRGHVAWSSCARLMEARAKQLVKGWARGGDVLLTHNATVGRVALVDGDAAPFLLGTSVTFYRLNPAALLSDYFYFFLLSPFWQDQMSAIMAQTTRDQVSIQKQAELVVLVPPLPEQHRMVAKVGALISACDELETALASVEDGRGRLLEALLHDALQNAAVPLSVELGAS